MGWFNSKRSRLDALQVFVDSLKSYPSKSQFEAMEKALREYKSGIASAPKEIQGYLESRAETLNDALKVLRNASDPVVFREANRPKPNDSQKRIEEKFALIKANDQAVGNARQKLQVIVSGLILREQEIRNRAA